MGVEERRERERQQRKRDILDAAKTLLVKKGIDDTSVNRIAKESELGIGTIYFYFKNKEEIFAEIQEEGLGLLYTYVTDAGKKKKHVEGKLAAAAAAYLNFSRECSEYFDVINYFITSPSTHFQSGLMARIHSKGASILSHVEGIIKQGIQQKIFIEKEPRRYAIFFWASLHGLLHIRKMEENTILAGENFDDFYAYCVKKLINSIRNESEIL